MILEELMTELDQYDPMLEVFIDAEGETRTPMVELLRATDFEPEALLLRAPGRPIPIR